MTAALVLVAEAATALKSDDANGGNSGIPVIRCASVAAVRATKLIPSFICCCHNNLYLY